MADTGYVTVKWLKDAEALPGSEGPQIKWPLELMYIRSLNKTLPVYLRKTTIPEVKRNDC